MVVILMVVLIILLMVIPMILLMGIPMIILTGVLMCSAGCYSDVYSDGFCRVLF